MKGLTRRQREIVDFIRDYIAVHNYSPSYREIMKYFGFTSLGSVYKHIAVLKRKGVLSAEKASARSVTLTKEEQEQARLSSVELPLLGSVSMGQPLELKEPKEKVSVPVHLIRDPLNSFVLEVNGDSMRDRGIHCGDHIVLENRPLAETGETVLAVVGGKVDLRQYHRDGDSAILKGLDDAVQHKRIPLKELKIRGVLRGLIRRYV